MKHGIGVHMLSLSISLGSMRDKKNLKKNLLGKNRKRVPPPGNTATSGVGGS